MSSPSNLHLSPLLLIVYLFLALLNLRISSASPVTQPLLPANLTSSLALLQPSHNLSEQRVTCDGSAYKRDLIYDECRDAFATIPIDTDLLSFGDRDYADFDMSLPYRWISCKSFNGICVEEEICWILN